MDLSFFKHPYEYDARFKKRVAYFSMEFGIDQSLKTYAGGLGFLGGSHLRSAFALKQNMIGISILWKFGYYDQIRKSDQTMDVLFQEKVYGFLRKTDIQFTINVSQHEVQVGVYYLPPEAFNTVPVFFLSTDLPGNDYLAKTICHRLYDSNNEARIAAAILLGVGGAKLLELINWEPEVYHLNESHGLPLAFHLYRKYGSIEEVKKRFVFSNHTPEEAGNIKTDLFLLEKIGFFCGILSTEIKKIAGVVDDKLDHTYTALRFSGLANGVSKLHLKTLQSTWQNYPNICKIISITNAQNFNYWADKEMYQALNENNDESLRKIKNQRKTFLFEEVADQCGEIYDEKVLTLVFAKRFAGYKRADLLCHNIERFHQLVTNKDFPIQIIWAGKPYPVDYAAIAMFDKIVHLCKDYPNCSILVGYEMKLSKMLKAGADVWLNVPRITHEASGTSGMAAAMNGALNVSIPDGWFPEFSHPGINSFLIPSADTSLSDHEQDSQDAEELMDVLEKKVLPTYYSHPEKWADIMKNSMKDITPFFDSDRLAQQYYDLIYTRVG
jgi:starch phosphorylase